jgi:hypothetical protein
MNTGLRKKGRIAIAWVLSISMVFATMTTPFAVAEDAPALDLHGITKVDSAQTEYIIPGENDFVFIKQATADKGTYVVWTRDALTDEQKQQILDYVIAQDGASDDDATLALTNFFVGFGTFEVTPDKGDPYSYTFSENDDGDIVLDNSADKVSHLWYGQYDRHYEISVTKVVTLNGDESTEAINGSVYVSLFSDAALTTMVEGTTPQMITITNGVGSTATFTVHATGIYYVAETDVNGVPVVAGGAMLGHNLESIENSHPEGIEVTVESENAVTITNNLNDEKEYGQIEVTKEVVVVSEDPEITVNYTFYAALFDENKVKISDVKPLVVVDSASTSVIFDGLDLDMTYYVYETDEDGNIIATEPDGKIVTPIIPDWTEIDYEGSTVALSPENKEGVSTIINTFTPQDLPLYGSILVNKTVTVNDKEFASNRTFYVALFADKELTEMVSEVNALKMNGKSSTTTEFLTDKDGNPLEAGTTYYIAETDKKGVPLTGTFEELGFEIDIDKAEIVIMEEGTEVNIINKFKSEEFPLTGDNSNMNLWLFLAMLGVAGALAPFAFRKKEVAND